MPTLAHHRQARRLTVLASIACVLLVAIAGGIYVAPHFASHLPASHASVSAASHPGTKPGPTPRLSSSSATATAVAIVMAAGGEQAPNDLSTPPFAFLRVYVPPTGMGRTPAPVVQAQAAFLFDPGRGWVFYEKNADQQRSIASLTKIMTLLLAADAGGRNLDQLIRIGPDAAALVSSANSYMGVSTGEQLTLRDLLYGLVVASGNDAAVAIAEGISSTQTSFVALMNSRARRLGLTQTVFVSPDGLDDGNRSTAHDLAILAAIVLETPEIEPITATWHATIPQSATHKAFSLWGSNDLLPGGPAAYPGANGVKTGYTEAALYCLVFSARRQGHLLVGVVLGDPSAVARDTDARALLDWGFALES